METHPLESPSAIPSVPNEERTTEDRTFRLFRDEEEVEKDVSVRHVGSLHELLTSTEAGSREKQEKFPNAHRVVAAFDIASSPRTVPSGENIARRPRLLVCGGFVRDVLLHEEPKDIDFATDVDYDEARRILEEYFKDEFAAEKISLGEQGKAFGVLRIRFQETGEEYEIASFREDGSYEDGRRPTEVTPVKHAGIDADRRDLTINALFYSPTSGNVIDYVGGLKDIDAKVLRFVGKAERRIAEDKLRMLRYVRFLLRTGFAPDESAITAIRTHAPEVRDLAAERVRDEMDKILRAGPAGDALKELKDCELLREILPEIDRLSDCPQGPPYHLEGDAFEHTVLVANDLGKKGRKKSGLALRWAAILHDIGKPQTRGEKTLPDGSIGVNFLGHEEAGVAMLPDIFTRLRFSNEDAEAITWLIDNHLRILHADEMKDSKANKLFSHPLYQELFTLGKADIAGSEASPELAEANRAMITRVEARYNKYLSEQAQMGSELAAAKKVVDGRLIMNIFAAVVGRELQPKTEGRVIGFVKDLALQIVEDRKILSPAEIRGVIGQIIESRAWEAR